MKPKLASKVKLRFDRRENRHLLLYPERGLALDDAALAIVKLCDGEHTIDAIVSELAIAHSADAETVARDVGVFLNELATRGLLAEGA